MTSMPGRSHLRLVPDDRRGLELLPGAVSFPLRGDGSPAPGHTLEQHLAAYGPRGTAAAAGQALLDALDATGLSGRGGGHFPVARKWRAVRDAAARTGGRPLVVGNGAEGEPASAKDLALLTARPHLVLDGLVDAAATVGADECVLWLHAGAREAHRSVSHAVLERRAAGLREARVRVVTGPDHYLSGESSAVVRALAGGPALPETRRVSAAVAGVHRRPTLVQNVETLARAALLARTGADGHRSATLLTVVAGGRRTVVEADVGCSVRAAALFGGWPVAAVPQAVLLGGYGGSWLSWAEAADQRLDEDSLRAAGASLGAGLVAPLPANACGVAETARLASYLASSSARQCGPCLFGLADIARVVAALARGDAGRRDVDRLRRWAGEVTGRGACHHPDGAVRMVLSALRTFDADVTAHRRRRPCASAAAVPLLPVPAGPG